MKLSSSEIQALSFLLNQSSFLLCHAPDLETEQLYSLKARCEEALAKGVPETEGIKNPVTFDCELIDANQLRAMARSVLTIRDECASWHKNSWQNLFQALCDRAWELDPL